ncbi:MAG: aminoacyl--tRNA ligase-related protein [Patescibacteria group bacterium]
MKLSHSLSQTSKSVAHDADSVNAKLLTQAGFVKKESAGVYSYLPFGRKVLAKIEQIVREEMNTVEGEEILMPALTPLENWKTTGRDKVDIAFHPTEKTVLGWSHEEIVTPLAKSRIKSYRDLPLCVYQIQTKFRNEPRAKSGLMRGREFLMKDMYSFHATREDFAEYYERVKKAYFKVFERCGLESFLVAAGGGEFTENISHEFQVLTDAGEDKLKICEKCGLGWNAEMAIAKCEKCGGELIEKKGAEVGNIFDLGTKYSDAFDLNFTNEKGEQQKVLMGCYGIGVSRLVATIAEVHHDEKGLIWPESVAPFQIHLIVLGNDKKVLTEAEKVYKELSTKTAVIFDDRDLPAGAKFADADLIGIPVRAVISAKTLEKGSIEIKSRSAKEADLIALKNFLAKTF